MLTTRPADDSDLVAESALNPRIHVVRVGTALDLDRFLIFDDEFASSLPDVQRGESLPSLDTHGDTVADPAPSRPSSTEARA